MNGALWVDLTLNGALIGGVWALLGLGKNLVLGTMRFVNFAHANFALVGMYLTYFLWHAWRINPYLILPVTAVATFVLGLVLDRPFARPLMMRGQRAQILATWGVAIILQYGASAWFGADTRSIQSSWNTSGFHIGSVIFVSKTALVNGFLSAAIVFATVGLINHTTFGLRLRAMSQNRDAAVYKGIDVNREFGYGFALTLSLAGVVGGLLEITTPVDPQATVPLFLLMFVVSVLGGLGSMLGNLLGGIAVGLMQGYTTMVLPAQLENMVVYIVFLLVLLFRPQGILGRIDVIRQGPL